MTNKLPDIFRADTEAVRYVEDYPVGTLFTSPNNFFLNHDGTMAFGGTFTNLLHERGYDTVIGVGRDLETGRLLMYIPISLTYRWRINDRKGYTLYPCDVVIVG